MKDLLDILAATAPPPPGAAIATVVATLGSAYRRPGARMLIRPDGSSIGGVSGGCIERDVILRSTAVVDARSPILVRYDTAPDIDGAPARALGCGGIVDVLIEPLDSPSIQALLSHLRQAHDDSRTLYITTAISAPSLGQRIIRDDTNILFTNLAATPPPNPALLHETIQPPVHLFIFGGGADVPPLLVLANTLGWRTTLVDLRSAAATISPHLPANQLLRGTPRQLPSVPATAAAVIMTHNYHHDRAILRHLLPNPPAYLGILGPRHRTRRILDELQLPAGMLHYPIGLDLGQSPEQIALAIAAEILATSTRSSAGFLTHRPGPIHPNTRELQPCPLQA